MRRWFSINHDGISTSKIERSGTQEWSYPAEPGLIVGHFQPGLVGVVVMTRFFLIWNWPKCVRSPSKGGTDAGEVSWKDAVGDGDVGRLRFPLSGSVWPSVDGLGASDEADITELCCEKQMSVDFRAGFRWKGLWLGFINVYVGAIQVWV